MLNLSAKESSTMFGFLLPGEKVIAVAKQRRLHGAIVYPTIAMATNRRIIIVNRWFMRLKSAITFVTYENISSFRVTHGIVFSSVKLRLRGSTKNQALMLDGKTEEGEIIGLSRGDAAGLANAITMVLNNYEVLDKGDLRNAKRGNYAEPAERMSSGISEVLGFDKSMQGYVSLEKSLQTNGAAAARTTLKPEDLLIFKGRAGKRT
jgi:hypothetical protein